MLQTTKNECVKNGDCFEHTWRDMLLQDYQAYLESIEQIAVHQIAMLKQASSAEIQTMFRQLSAQAPEAFPSQTETENTGFIIAIVTKTVALVADSGLDRVVPANAFSNFFKEVGPEFSIGQALLGLVGIDCKYFQHRAAAAKRNCLIGAAVNFKLKALAILREDYARHCKAVGSEKAEVNMQIA
jgi:hypothetical protein